MNKILDRMLSRIPWVWIIILTISVVIALIIKIFISAPFAVILFGVFFTIGLGFSLFLLFRQLYWFITKKGDYEKKNIKK